MTTLWVAPQHQTTLALNQLAEFDAIWNVKVDWFEAPNERRGGWSGVGRMRLKTVSEASLGVFLKRQENHGRRTLMHPIKGEPTFVCEFKMMQHLAQHQVPSLKAVAFGQRNFNGNMQALLMTEELVGFIPLEQLTEQLFAESRPPLQLQRTILRAIALHTRLLHAAKVQHRSFYPKHLFVNMADASEPQVAVIDLEKSRINPIAPLRSLVDLAAINRHSLHWSHSQRMYFYLQYLGLKRLTPYAKWLCRRIIKRSRRVKHP